MDFLTKKPRTSPRGSALVIVLASLVFLAALAVAFLTSVSTELKSSKANAQATNTQLLAQSVVNLALAQINKGTQGVDDAGNTLCWASQPGMIRTYNDSGNPADYFKLYSWDVMQGTGTFDPDSATERVPSDWDQQKSVFVDLNEPVSVGGKKAYPIIDGNDLETVSGDKTYDADGDGNADIQGFLVSGTATPVSASATANPIPMPVKWLYVLADGQIVAPQGTGDKINGASTKNAIVGRVAFWADDETCKVNINTASEGAFNTSLDAYAPWDVPRFFTSYDQTYLAKNQPFQHEFQRYPGHPAMVSLSSVFGGFTGLSAYPENIYPVTPRIIGGGSLGGSTTTSGSQILPLRGDRLYASVDELEFKPTLNGPDRSLNDPTAGVLNKDTLQRAKFFLTASSRAPDVNLFNTPRVSIWPVSANGVSLPDRSPLDQLTAFCATINTSIYYFQRKDPNDPDTDLPALSSNTGLGRNRMLMEYLRRETSANIPGFGGKFSDKYSATDTLGGSGITGTERDQILTEIFDYIRSTNTYDQSLSASSTNPVKTYTSAFNASGNGPGKGQVVPIVDPANGTRGFGRFPTLQQASLIFFPSKDNGASPTPAPNQMQAVFVLQLFDPSLGFPWSIPWYQIEVSGLDAFTWDDGATPMFNTSTITIGTPYAGSLNLEPMMGGVVGWRRLFYQNSAYQGTGNTGAGFSTRFPLNPPAASTFARQGITGIHFTGGNVTIDIYQNLANGTKGKLLQSIAVNFPNAPASGFPLPGISTSASTATATYGAPWSEDWSNRVTAWIGTANAGKGEITILGDHDTVRSVLASPGDMRIVAARRTLTSTAAKSLFQQHPNWNGTFSPGNMAHAFRTSYGGTFDGTFYASGGGGGRLVPLGYSGWLSSAYVRNTEGGSLAFQDPCDSDVSTASGVFVGGTGTIPGDWDNGVGNWRDGVYINKPDEGSSVLSGDIPYYDVYKQNPIGETFFSQNRMIPSAGMFGSLPTGVLANKPWQTLLFRPGPGGHPGLGSPENAIVGPPYTTPPDHLLLDLFTLPVVEPYAISEPLSTAGRINMNYQIIPFKYIVRQTGIYAALKSMQVISVPDADASVYKTNNPFGPSTNAHNYRLGINMPLTLAQFDARFNNKDIFRSASEICSIDLVPSDAGALSNPGTPAWRAAMDAYWSTHRLTGDNSRERPYANLYPLLTTKSNTYTIHFRVQALKKSPLTAPDVWTEGTDKVLGEYRGYQTVERYVDSSNGAIPDYADNSTNPPIGKFYKFRVLQAKQFAP